MRPDLRGLHHVALFLLGVTLGGLSLLHGGACIDWGNPEGGLARQAVRACPIQPSDPDACVACLATSCCDLLDRCDSFWAGQCDHTVRCFEGITYCGSTLDDSSWAVLRCAQAHCTGTCPGPKDCQPGGDPGAQALVCSSSTPADGGA